VLLVYLDMNLYMRRFFYPINLNYWKICGSIKLWFPIPQYAWPWQGIGESWRWCRGCSQGINTSSPKLSCSQRYLYRGPHEDASCSSITGLIMIIAPFLHFNTFPFGLHFHQFKDDQCLCALFNKNVRSSDPRYFSHDHKFVFASCWWFVIRRHDNSFLEREYYSRHSWHSWISAVLCT